MYCGKYRVERVTIERAQNRWEAIYGSIPTVRLLFLIKTENNQEPGNKAYVKTDNEKRFEVGDIVDIHYVSSLTSGYIEVFPVENK